MDMDKAQKIGDRLVAHGIRRTPFRIELLQLFIESKSSLSHQEVKEKITSTKDKVTIYRALDNFLEKGLIHKVPDVNNVARYAVCPDNCAQEAHVHNHVHFVCESCEKTFCLDNVEVPSVQVPEGFNASSFSYTVTGLCKTCGGTA